MELPSIKNVKNPEYAKQVFDEIESKLAELKLLAKDGDLAFPIKDKKIIHVWEKKIKPINQELDPVIDEYIALNKQIEEWQAEGKKFQEKEEELNKKKNALELRRAKFINRISPMIIREYNDKITKYQQFGKIKEFVDENGEVKLYVTIHDWLASWTNGYDTQKDEHNKKVVSKVHQKLANTNEAMEEVEEDVEE